MPTIQERQRLQAALRGRKLAQGAEVTSFATTDSADGGAFPVLAIFEASLPGDVEYGEYASVFEKIVHSVCEPWDGTGIKYGEVVAL